MPAEEHEFEQLRPASFAIAYRMLGSVSEAEDVGQEALLHVHQAIGAQHAEMADSLSLAMLVLLESLSPERRAALLLHDVFDYGYPEIAAIIGKSEANVRQLASRARRHVEERRPRFQSSREEREQLAQRFLAAAQHGDLAGLKALLAHDGPDRRRRPEGPGAGAVAARSHPRRPHAVHLDAGRLAMSRFHAAADRGKRWSGPDRPGRSAAADQRVVA
ncbi:MAG: sigma factor-like helix-turn-helix DNA-binding protein [Solirubrobacteraceae bacterium]